MKQLTVISGKGGTGKTSFVGAFATLAKDKVLADCDVDASDLHLILKPDILEETDFMGLKTAKIDAEKCTRCGLCVEKCRFNAIEDYTVESLACEGCGVCEYVCPSGAVTMADNVSGKAYVSETRHGPLCHARLYPGEEASGKLVSLVREKAKKVAEERDLELALIDGSPGIGCPVIASIGGVDLVLVVTEPTMSGIHDLERILDVTRHFGIKSLVCVNKYDINIEKTNEAVEFCRRKGVPVIGKIPYDISFTRAMVEEKTLAEYGGGETASLIEDVWKRIMDELENG